MQDEETPTLQRRGLLRKAGAVAAGIGAAGLAATPAQAVDVNLIQGQNNVVPTTFTGGDSSSTPLTLTNSQGAPLTLTPATSLRTTAPVGSVYVDGWGDFYGVGNIYNSGGAVGPPYITPLYSSTWATMTIPITPMRWLVTLPNFTMPNGYGGRDFVVGNPQYDSSGRLVPVNGGNNNPDLTLSFAPWFAPNSNGFVAVQGNLSILSGAANDGWCALFPGDEPWPGTASTGFNKVGGGWNFTQTVLDQNFRMNIKISTPGVVVFDIMGFVVSDQIAQFATASTAHAAVAGALAKTPNAQRPSTPRRD